MAQDVAAAVERMDLGQRTLMVDSSLSSFGHVEGGVEAAVLGLMTRRRTVLVPTMSFGFPAQAVLELAADAIRTCPEITRCDDPACVRCADAVAGGPLL